MWLTTLLPPLDTNRELMSVVFTADGWTEDGWIEEGGLGDEMTTLWLKHEKEPALFYVTSLNLILAQVFMEGYICHAYMINELRECERRSVQLC